jgi:hypothetical protein
MKLITLPGLRLGQLQTVSESSLDICKGIPEIAPETGNVKRSLTAFKEGMLKDKASAEEKGKLDINRDLIVSGFMNVVLEEQKFPNKDVAIVATHAALLKIVKKYGFNIIRLRRAEETAAIDNLLADIAQMDITPLTPTGIPRWIPVIEAANEEYKLAAKEFISDTTDTGFTKSASSLAPALEEALEDLYTMLFVTIKRSPSDALKKAYGDLETLIDSMN